MNLISGLMKSGHDAPRSNYSIEAATTQRFAERLKDDPRYIVPQIVDEFCAPKSFA